MKEKSTRFDSFIPEDLKRQLKAKLALEGKSMAAWVREKAQQEVVGFPPVALTTENK